MSKNGSKLGVGTHNISKIYLGLRDSAGRSSISAKDFSTSVIDENPACKVHDGEYFCQDGFPCNKEIYLKECIPENPKTGNYLPYIIVLIGL